MRIWVGSTALLLALAAGCNLPQRRPDARLYVSHCARDVGGDFAPGKELVGSVVPHRTCVRLDARASSTFTGGATRYVWTVRYDPPSTTAALPPGFPTGIVTLVSSNGAFSEGSFFDHVAVDQTKAHLQLTVIDASGLTREDDTDLTLTDAPPKLGARRIVQPRVFGLYIDPFFVVEPQVTDGDVPPPANGYVSQRDADLADEVRLDVQQVVPADKPPLQSMRCSDVGPHLGFPDPSHGNPLAWCFSLTPLDDRTTPVVEKYCATPGPGCFDSVVQGHPDDEAVSMRLLVNAVEPNGLVHPMPADCTTSDDRSGCVTVSVEDEVWTASGVGNFTQGAMVGRIAPDWLRSPADVTLDARDGVGVAGDVKGKKRWFGADDPGLCTTRGIQKSAECGALLGIDANLARTGVDGFGEIVGVDPDRTDGVWVSALSISSSLNPTASSGNPAVVPDGDYYVTYLSSAMLFGASSGQPLSSTPQSALGILHGFHHGGPAASNEAPMQVLRVGSDVLLTTAEICDHLQPASVSAPASCSSNAALPGGVGPYRLRELTLPPGGAFGGIDLDAAGIDGVTIGLAGNSGPFHFLAPSGDGRVWLLRTTPSNPLGSTWQAELHDLPYVDAQTDAVVPMPTDSYPLGIAYDSTNDELWVADAQSGRVMWFSAASQSSVAAPAAPSYVATPFTFPLALAVDGNGGLWVDDHLDELHRRAAYVDPTTRDATMLDVYVSGGLGIEPADRLGGDTHTAIWRADAADVVRAPADNPSEIPTLAYPSVFSAMGGVDPVDGAAYVYSIETGQNLFRVDVDGTVTGLAAGGRIEAGAFVPSLVVTTNQIATTSSALLLAVYPSGGGLSFVGALDADRLRVATASTVPIADCPVSDPRGKDVAEPCWMRLDGGTSRIPLVLGTTPVTAEMMRVSLDEVPNASIAIRAYFLAQDGAGGQYLASLAPIAYPPVSSGPSGFEAYVKLAPADAPAAVPQPISSFTMATPGAILGGVWLVKADGSAQRFYASGSTIVPDASLVIPPYPAGYVTEAVATNPFDLAFATMRSTGGGPSLLAWGYLDDGTGTPKIIGLGETPIHGTGEALVSSDFSSVAWMTGDDGTLERWRLVVDTALGLTMMRPEYVRPPDLSGTLGPTPAGWSIKAGTF